MSAFTFPLPRLGERARVRGVGDSITATTLTPAISLREREDEIRNLPAHTLATATLTPALSLRERGRT